MINQSTVSGETVTITESRAKLWLYLALTISLASLFTVLIYDDWRKGLSFGTCIATAIVFLFWIGAGAFVFRLVRPLGLVLSPQGFHLSNWKEATPWCDVEEFRLVYMRFSIWSRTMTFHDQGPGLASVGWTLKPDAPSPLLRRFNSALAGVSGVVPHTMAGGAPKLLALLKDWRGRYGRSRPEDTP